MSELKVYVPQDGPYGLEPEEGGVPVEEETCYLKTEVDKVLAEKDAYIAELKQEIERLKEENEMTLVGVNLRSPTSDGRFV